MVSNRSLDGSNISRYLAISYHIGLCNDYLTIKPSHMIV